MLKVSLLTHEQPEDQAQHDADNDRGGDGEKEFEIFSFDRNVARQAAEAGFLQ